MVQNVQATIESLGRCEDGVYAVDSDHRIILWNQAAERILGYRAEEVMGRYCYDVVFNTYDARNSQCQENCKVMQLACRAAVTSSLTALAVTRDGTEKVLHVTHMTLPLADDGTFAVVHVFQEVTEQLNVQEIVRELARYLERRFGSQRREPHPAPATAALALSHRELEVLELLGRGLGTCAIAQTLVVTPATARNHIQNVLSKLDVHTRLEAVAYGFEHGLITTPTTSRGSSPLSVRSL